MSANDPACFTPVAASQQAYLVKKSDGDNIIARSGDHNYRFYAYTPYDASIKISPNFRRASRTKWYSESRCRACM